MPNFDSFSSKEKDKHICGLSSMSAFLILLFFFFFFLEHHPTERAKCIQFPPSNQHLFVRTKIKWHGGIKTNKQKIKNKQNDWPSLFIKA